MKKSQRVMEVAGVLGGLLGDEARLRWRRSRNGEVDPEIYEQMRAVTLRMRALVRDPILALGERRHLPRMVIGQILLERGPTADRYIGALGLSYVKAVEDIVEEGVRSGAFRKVESFADAVADLVLHGLVAQPPPAE
jgi:hypothetical protein